jgi:hypothetical protein
MFATVYAKFSLLFLSECNREKKETHTKMLPGEELLLNQLSQTTTSKHTAE